MTDITPERAQALDQAMALWASLRSGPADYSRIELICPYEEPCDHLGGGRIIMATRDGTPLVSRGSARIPLAMGRGDGWEVDTDAAELWLFCNVCRKWVGTDMAMIDQLLADMDGTEVDPETGDRAVEHVLPYSMEPAT